MNQIQTPTLTPVLPAENHQHTTTNNTHLLPLSELVGTPLAASASPQPTLGPNPISPTFTELLTAYQTSIEKPPVPFIPNQPEPSNPFTFSQTNLATITPQPVQWLWHNRIPLSGITLLDGDHKLGKTLLAHQIAAAVSSGTPMPDGSPTIQSGVVIITPYTDSSTTQRQLLANLGADLSHIKILSLVPNQDPPSPQPHQFPPEANRRFSLPEDLTHLFTAIKEVDARLIIFDPFIHLLSKHHRYTNLRLCHLLADLNHFLITHHIACLLLRNCRAKGGHAKPTTLEQSDHFLTIAASRLLLAPDPLQPNLILLSHAFNRHSALTPTLTCHIQPLPTNPNLAHFTIQGTHSLQASHLLTQRPDTLHRRLLAQQLLHFLANSTEPVAATTLYDHFPTSSTSQVQHALKDLLLRGHIHRPTRGFYTLNSTAATHLDPSAATTLIPAETPKLNVSAATTLTSTAPTKLDAPVATTLTSTEAPKLNVSAAITPTPTITPNFDATAATTSPATPKLNVSAAITSPTTPKFNQSPATITKPKASRPHKHPPKQNKSHGRPGQGKKRH